MPNNVEYGGDVPACVVCGASSEMQHYFGEGTGAIAWMCCPGCATKFMPRYGMIFISPSPPWPEVRDAA